MNTARKVMEVVGEALSRVPEELSVGFALTPANRVEKVDVAKIAIALEEAFGLTLWDERVAQWRRLGDVLGYIQELLEQGEGEPLERNDEERVAWYYEYK